MKKGSYTIIGNDFERAGIASRNLKEQLKKIGVDPETIRRTMIASYEAEMNVVIYALEGVMMFTMTDTRIDIEVSDRGPGIRDIEKAMEEGFSTAPPAVREMGFGAGLGLPNIKKSSDLFKIDSSVGKGTVVRFSIYLKPQKKGRAADNSLLIAQELCSACLRCLRTCPTEALRVRGNEPEIIGRLCIDCPKCIGACDTDALSVNCMTSLQRRNQSIPLIVPTSFFFQFGPGVDKQRVIEALKSLGFAPVYVLEAWENALRRAVVQFAGLEAKTLPVISPLCPPILNLIELRFPSLLNHVAPFLSPIESARNELKGEKGLFVVECPGQRTAIKDEEALNVSSLIQEVFALLHKDNNHKANKMKRDEIKSAGVQKSQNTKEVIRISGIHHVLDVLEKAENGLLDSIMVLEPFVCDNGCFGSPLLVENSFIAYHRWFYSHEDRPQNASVIRREEPLTARQGLRLDNDMSRAIQKLAMIDRLTRSLPAKDCGMCGAPSCASFAEDVVLGKKPRTDCIYCAWSEKRSEEREDDNE